MACRRAARQARPARHARLPDVDHLHVLGRRAAHRDVVREGRHEHVRHASVHSPAVGGGRSGMAVEERLGDLQGHREALLRAGRGPPRDRARRRARADRARQRGRARAAVRRARLEARRMRCRSRQDDAGRDRRRSRLSEHVPQVHVARAADGAARQRRQGHRLGREGRGRAARRAELPRDRGGLRARAPAHRQRARCGRGDPRARARDERRGRGEGVAGAVGHHRPRARAPRARARTRRSAFATSRRSRARSSRRRRGAGSNPSTCRTTRAM